MNVQNAVYSQPLGSKTLPQNSETSLFTRVVLSGLGSGFVAIAVVGIFLPGIPTTGPLIAASFLLARGNPKLQSKILGHPIFRPYRPYLDGSIAMPLRARIWALAGMWVSILASCFLMIQTVHSSAVLMSITVAMGLVGTGFILLFRRAGNTTPVMQVKRELKSVQDPELEILSSLRDFDNIFRQRPLIQTISVGWKPQQTNALHKTPETSR